MSYIIASDSRQRDEVLFMVDRRLQRQSFWSNRVTEAFEYVDAAAAKAKVASLKFNNPRVMTVEAARELSKHQSFQRAVETTDDQEWDTARAHAELCWDGHKGAL